MSCPIVFKQCKKCGEIKHVSEYHKNKTCKFGVKNICKKCSNEYSKNYRDENKDYFRNYRLKYREDNIQYFRDYSKEYFSTKKGIVKRINSNTKNRCKYEHQIHDCLTVEMLNEMLNFFDYKDAYTNEVITNLSIDHIVPLSKNGINEIYNIVVCNASTNKRKYTKNMESWYKDQDFFSEERLQKIYKWIAYSHEKFFLSKDKNA